MFHFLTRFIPFTESVAMFSSRVGLKIRFRTQGYARVSLSECPHSIPGSVIRHVTFKPTRV